MKPLIDAKKLSKKNERHPRLTKEAHRRMINLRRLVQNTRLSSQKSGVSEVRIKALIAGREEIDAGIATFLEEVLSLPPGILDREEVHAAITTSASDPVTEVAVEMRSTLPVASANKEPKTLPFDNRDNEVGVISVPALSKGLRAKITQSSLVDFAVVKNMPLIVSDVMTEFGVSRRTALAHLKQAVSAGALIETVAGSRGKAGRYVLPTKEMCPTSANAKVYRGGKGSAVPPESVQVAIQPNVALESSNVTGGHAAELLVSDMPLPPPPSDLTSALNTMSDEILRTVLSIAERKLNELKRAAGL